MKRDFKLKEKPQILDNKIKKIINDLTNKCDKLECDLSKEKEKIGFVRTKFPKKKKTNIFNRFIALLNN